MSKKILLISAVILALTVILTACKSEVNGPTPESTDKVVQTVTVTGKDGGVTKVEVFEDTSGDKYITNVDGDKIPLTTDDQGFSDDIGYLVTSRPAASNPSNTEGNTGSNSSTKPVNQSEPSGSENPSSSTTEKTTDAEKTTGGGIVIGSKVQQDTIRWDDIKNPKK